MAVTSIKELWKGRDGDGGLEETTYTRVFRVWTSVTSDDATTVGTALAATPWDVFPGAEHPNDSNAFCVSSRPVNDLGPLGWIVTATYSTRRDRAEAPEDDPLDFEWSEEDFQRPRTKDRDGDSILNSAGDPPDPPVMDEDSTLIVTVSGNVAANPAWLRTYKKAINTDSFDVDGETVAAKYARIKSIKLGPWRYRGSNMFRAATVQIAIADEDGLNWEDQTNFIDRGYRYLETDGSGNSTLTKITNPDGTDPTEPVLLDGSGGILASPDATNVVYRDSKIVKLKAFKSIVLGCV